jgi:hypothetical protein
MMPAKQQDEQHPVLELQETRPLDTVIGGQVMRTLGLPGSLHAVQVRRLWGDRYRVNVLVGADATSVKIVHSYFIVVDGEGSIVAATPQISKQY